MPTYLVRHVTTYRYKSPVAFGEHRMLLRPRESFDQHTVRSQIDISPQPVETTWSEDVSGNLVGICRFGRRARELRFTAVMTVEQALFDPAALSLPEHAGITPFSYGAEEMPDLARFIERQHQDPDRLVDAFARRILGEDPARATFAFLCRLNATIQRDFAYVRREEAGIQAPALTLRLQRGSCRDFSILMAEAVRSLGFAARFVSGYLHVRSDNSGAVAAGGNTHAWLQIYLPGAGWIDFDPTSGGVGNGDLVRVAVVRDPRHAAPLTGSFMGFPSDSAGMDVAVTVTLKEGTASSAALPIRSSAAA